MSLFNRHIKVKFLEIGINFGGHINHSDNPEYPVDVEFEVTHEITKYPNEAVCTLYNLNKTHREMIAVEHTAVEIEAGYWPLDGSPNVERMFLGRTESVESYLMNDGVTIATEVKLGDGQKGYQYARINKTLPAGDNSPKRQIDECIKELGNFNISPRIFRDVPDQSTPMAITMHGTVVDNMSRVARDHRLIWNITDEKVEVYPKDKPAIDKKLYVINSNSGMIGSPRVSDIGITVTCLLIPSLRPGRLVEIQSKLTSPEGKLYRIETSKFNGSLMGSKKFTVHLECREYTGSVRRSLYRGRDEGG